MRRCLPPGAAAAFLCVAAPFTAAHAQRSCDAWSAEITAVEGVAEVQRFGSPQWVGLASRERVCSGDAIRVGASSRATITLPDQSTLKLDEHTTLTLPEPPSGSGSLIELLRGVIHVISRDPRLLHFATPYANAGLEGTEFDIRVDDRERLTEVVVLEGEVVVTTSAGELGVTSDHVAVAREGQLPTVAALPDPIELMRWASHYPSIVAEPLPAADQAPSAAQALDARFFAHRAAARLTTGGVDAAAADLDTALRLSPEDATALALRSLLALARADRTGARGFVARALAAEPDSVAALVARSHVEQSSGDLPAAEASVAEALRLEPNHWIALTRQAELALAQGDARAAVATANRARAASPTSSEPLIVLGFASLGVFDSRAAQTAFETAAALDPAAPLPRVGLALAQLQRGEAAEGRRQLELAVALDPANPLTRSYMARVYATERRAALTASQLELAKEFDPADPTPWLQSALQLLRSNRPVEALHELRAAAAKNGDRPVFRSSLDLDEDVATRSAGLSRVHTELGFGRLALLDAWSAIADDPANFAGHRLLADAYSTEPRHEIARVSELLVSQLLQPANVAPIKPQQAQPDLFISQRSGPSHVSFDELGAPILQNGLKLRASAVGGGNDTSGEDLTLAGLHDRLSYSVGHYQFATDGFRDNNDLDQSVTNAFVQFRPSHATNLQAELRSVRTEHGDLTMLFDPNLYSPLLRLDEDADSVRLGAKQRLSRRGTLLASVIAQDVTSTLTTGDAFSIGLEQGAYSIDIQHIRTGRAATLQSGILYAEQDEDVTTSVMLPGFGPTVSTTSGDNRQLGLYSYARFEPTPTLTLTAGGSFDSIDDGFADEDELNPKLGVVWRPTTRTTVRAAAFETLFGSLTTSTQNPQPRLEPVELAGFTQLLFGGRADRSTVRGLAVEQQVAATVFVGAEASVRDTERVVLDSVAPQPTTIDVTLGERLAQAYVYWTPLAQLSVSTRYEHGRYSSEPLELFGYSTMTTRRLPLELRYFARGGFTAGARATFVDQEGVFLTAPASPLDAATLVPGEDRFVVLDAFLGYRLPNRRGLLSLNADNLLDEEFRFQDVDPTSPSIIAERLVSFRFTLAFD